MDAISKIIVYEPHSDSAFWGAFWGAFLAFIFGLLTYIITKRRERFVNHLNALVKTERFLYQNLEDLSELKEISRMTADNLSADNFSTLRFRNVTFQDDFHIDIGSLHLLNELAYLRLRIKAININIQSINRSLERAEIANLSHIKVVSSSYSILSENLCKLGEDAAIIQKHIRSVILEVRIRIKHDSSRSTFIYGVIKDRWDFEITQAALEIERTQFMSEVTDINSKYQQQHE